MMTFLISVMKVLINLLFIRLCPVFKPVYNTQPSFDMVNGSFNPICTLSRPVYCQSDEIAGVFLDSDLKEIELFVETGT